MSLAALFHKFNGLYEEGRKLGLYGNSRAWDLAQPTRALSFREKEGYIGFNEIIDVVYSGVKQVFRLSTDHGTSIKATADHEFLTTRGYVRLDELWEGDKLFAYREGVLINDNSTGHHMNKYRCAPRLQKVASIKRVGRMPTYDIKMRAPDHNFTANGLVVHNCGKSLTAKAVATAWGVPLLRLDLGALKSKFVGESEGNLRRALRVVEAIGRCVVWLDEVEKSLQGATSGSADGGVSADALGAILSWMQERAGEAFVLATANDVSALPPEFLRKGRFDEVWWVDLPNQVEREAILLATLASHGRNMSLGGDFQRVASHCDRFTGAEIAAIVPDAMFAAFADGAREVSAKDLIAAAKTVVPLADTASEKITRMRAWAHGRARFASRPESGRGESRGRKIDL